MEIPREIRHQIESVISRLFQFLVTPDMDIHAMRSWVEKYIKDKSAHFSVELTEKFIRDENTLEKEEKEETRKKKKERNENMQEFKGDQKKIMEYFGKEKKSTTVITPHIFAPVTMKLSNTFINLVYLFQNSGARLARKVRTHFGNDTESFFDYCLDLAYIYAVVCSPFHEVMAKPPHVPSLSIKLITEVLEKKL